jgi:hypothetical protein
MLVIVVMAVVIVIMVLAMGVHAVRLSGRNSGTPESLLGQIGCRHRVGFSAHQGFLW